MDITVHLGRGGAHSGIDIQAPDGACVVAAGAGTVLDAKPNPCRIYGNQVVIDHGDGIFSQSAHLATTVVNPGDNVVAGQLIGTIGRTGDVPPRMDTHLHFEVRLGSPNSPYEGGQVRDPLSFFYPAGG